MSQEFKKLAGVLIKPSKHLRSSGFFAAKSAFHTGALENASEYQVKLLPKPSRNSKILLPISMGRYDCNKDKRKQYDQDIHALLTYTGEELARGHIGSVEVLSSAGLQEVTWGKQKSKEIEDYFVGVHHGLLTKQTAFYTWDEFTQKLGKEELEKNYQMIKAASNVGSEWYGLMVKVCNGMRTKGELEKSLEYQRLEYAAIRTMRNQYTHVVYMGNLAVSWAYLYRVYDKLPIFMRAVIERPQQRAMIGTTEATTVIRMIHKNVEDVLLDERFPVREKQKMSDMLMSLIYAYTPKSQEDKPQESSLNFGK